MLYDKRWDVFSLDSLIAWLERQPHNQPYDYCHGSVCLLGQYFTAKGMVNACAGTSQVYYGGELRYYEPLPKGWNLVARGWLFQGRTTFGAALRRAKLLRWWQKVWA